MRTLREQGTEVGLILCEDGILREGLKARVVELGQSKDVVFAGSVPHAEILSVLGGADLLEIPALLDWTPRVAVKAAAVGTPCVLTSAVGCVLWMAEAGAGRVVPPASPETLAETIGEWLSDHAGRAEAGRRAVAWADTFAVDRIAGEVWDFHRHVAATFYPGGAGSRRDND
jgi:glycosyltransferase involved in cell wall biosynthesis